jgi:uncharacterized membrane protein YdjX (TVP38/TMEM64 family)
MKLPRALGWTLLGGLVLALIVVPFLLGESALFELSRAWLNQPENRVALAFGVAALLAADLFLPIPSSFVAAGAVAALGPVLGGGTVWLGMTVGALLGYALGRYGGSALALRVVGADELERAGRLHQRFGTAVLIVCRGVPVLAEASTVFAGALGMPFAGFAFVVGAANLGLSLAYALLAGFGSGTVSVLAPFVLGIAVPALALAIVRRLEPMRRVNE